MFGDGRGIFRGGEEPVPGRVGVGQRFLGGEGLGGDDEERGLGLEDFELLGDVGAIDVGDEMDAQARLAVGLERLGDHDRAEVGTADADVDDIGDRLAGVSLPLRRSGWPRRISACARARR